jgi:hypothetical protein
MDYTVGANFRISEYDMAFPSKIIAVLIAALVVLPTDVAFGKQRHCILCRLAPRIGCSATAKTQARGGPDVIPVDVQLAGSTTETKVLALLRNAGIKPGDLPSGELVVDDPKIRSCALKWHAVQVPLERLIQQELRLESTPDLYLALKSSTDAQGRVRYKLVFSHPGDSDVIQLLCRTLVLDSSIFEHGLLPIGELGNYVDEDFKPEMFINGELRFSKIQGAVREVLQSDKQLSELAIKGRGAFKPVIVSGDLKSEKMQVLTEWQQLAGNNDVRIYWRARISLERLPDRHLRMESVIDFGERYRSQSFDQIQTITDSNKIGKQDWIDAVEPFGNPADNKVRYQTFRPSSENLLTAEARSLFGEIASVMWDKVRSSILKAR